MEEQVCFRTTDCSRDSFITASMAMPDVADYFSRGTSHAAILGDLKERALLAGVDALRFSESVGVGRIENKTKNKNKNEGKIKSKNGETSGGDGGPTVHGLPIPETGQLVSLLLSAGFPMPARDLFILSKGGNPKIDTLAPGIKRLLNAQLSERGDIFFSSGQWHHKYWERRPAPPASTLDGCGYVNLLWQKGIASAAFCQPRNAGEAHEPRFTVKGMLELTSTGDTYYATSDTWECASDAKKDCVVKLLKKCAGALPPAIGSMNPYGGEGPYEGRFPEVRVYENLSNWASSDWRSGMHVLLSTNSSSELMQSMTVSLYHHLAVPYDAECLPGVPFCYRKVAFQVRMMGKRHGHLIMFGCYMGIHLNAEDRKSLGYRPLGPIRNQIACVNYDVTLMTVGVLPDVFVGKNLFEEVVLKKTRSLKFGHYADPSGFGSMVEEGIGSLIEWVKVDLPEVDPIKKSEVRLVAYCLVGILGALLQLDRGLALKSFDSDLLIAVAGQCFTMVECLESAYDVVIEGEFAEMLRHVSHEAQTMWGGVYKELGFLFDVGNSTSFSNQNALHDIQTDLSRLFYAIADTRTLLMVVQRAPRANSKINVLATVDQTTRAELSADVSRLAEFVNQMRGEWANAEDYWAVPWAFLGAVASCSVIGAGQGTVRAMYASGYTIGGLCRLFRYLVVRTGASARGMLTTADTALDTHMAISSGDERVEFDLADSVTQPISDGGTGPNYSTCIDDPPRPECRYNERVPDSVEPRPVPDNIEQVSVSSARRRIGRPSSNAPETYDIASNASPASRAASTVDDNYIGYGRTISRSPPLRPVARSQVDPWSRMPDGGILVADTRVVAESGVRTLVPTNTVEQLAHSSYNSLQPLTSSTGVNAPVPSAPLAGGGDRAAEVGDSDAIFNLQMSDGITPSPGFWQEWSRSLRDMAVSKSFWAVTLALAAVTAVVKAFEVFVTREEAWHAVETAERACDAAKEVIEYRKSIAELISRGHLGQPYPMVRTVCGDLLPERKLIEVRIICFGRDETYRIVVSPVPEQIFPAVEGLAGGGIFVCPTTHLGESRKRLVCAFMGSDGAVTRSGLVPVSFVVLDSGKIRRKVDFIPNWRDLESVIIVRGRLAGGAIDDTENNVPADKGSMDPGSSSSGEGAASSEPLAAPGVPAPESVTASEIAQRNGCGGAPPTDKYNRVSLTASWLKKKIEKLTDGLATVRPDPRARARVKDEKAGAAMKEYQRCGYNPLLGENESQAGVIFQQNVHRAIANSTWYGPAGADVFELEELTRTADDPRAWRFGIANRYSLPARSRIECSLLQRFGAHSTGATWGETQIDSSAYVIFPGPTDMYAAYLAKDTAAYMVGSADKSWGKENFREIAVICSMFSILEKGVSSGQYRRTAVETNNHLWIVANGLHHLLLRTMLADHHDPNIAGVFVNPTHEPNDDFLPPQLVRLWGRGRVYTSLRVKHHVVDEGWVDGNGNFGQGYEDKCKAAMGEREYTVWSRSRGEPSFGHPTSYPRVGPRDLGYGPEWDLTAWDDQLRVLRRDAGRLRARTGAPPLDRDDLMPSNTAGFDDQARQPQMYWEGLRARHIDSCQVGCNFLAARSLLQYAYEQYVLGGNGVTDVHSDISDACHVHIHPEWGPFVWVATSSDIATILDPNTEAQGFKNWLGTHAVIVRWDHFDELGNPGAMLAYLCLHAVLRGAVETEHLSSLWWGAKDDASHVRVRSLEPTVLDSVLALLRWDIGWTGTTIDPDREGSGRPTAFIVEVPEGSRCADDLASVNSNGGLRTWSEYAGWNAPPVGLMRDAIYEATEFSLGGAKLHMSRYSCVRNLAVCYENFVLQNGHEPPAPSIGEFGTPLLAHCVAFLADVESFVPLGRVLTSEAKFITELEWNDILGELIVSGHVVSAAAGSSAPATYPDDLEDPDPNLKELLDELVEPEDPNEPAPDAPIADKKSWRKAVPGRLDRFLEGGVSPAQVYDFIADKISSQTGDSRELVRKVMEYDWTGAPVQTVAERLGMVDRGSWSDCSVIKCGSGWGYYVASWPENTRRVLKPTREALTVSVADNTIVNGTDADTFKLPLKFEVFGHEVFSQVFNSVIDQCDDIQSLLGAEGRNFIRRKKPSLTTSPSDRSIQMWNCTLVEDMRKSVDFARSRAVYGDRFIRRIVKGPYALVTLPEVLPMCPGTTLAYDDRPLDGAMLKGHHKDCVPRPPARLNRHKSPLFKDTVPIAVIPSEECFGSAIRRGIITGDELKEAQHRMTVLRLSGNPAENVAKGRSVGKITTSTVLDSSSGALALSRIGRPPHLAKDPNKVIISKALARGLDPGCRSKVFIARKDGNERRGFIIDEGQFVAHIWTRSQMAVYELVRQSAWSTEHAAVNETFEVSKMPAPFVYQSMVSYLIPNPVGNVVSLTSELCMEPRGTFLVDHDVAVLNQVVGRSRKTITWPGHRLAEESRLTFMHDDSLADSNAGQDTILRSLDLSSFLA